MKALENSEQQETISKLEKDLKWYKGINKDLVAVNSNNKKSIKKLREAFNGFLNDFAHLAWKSETDMVDPQDLAELVDKKRAALQELGGEE